MTRPAITTLLFTVLSLIAFAANSVLGRLALGDGAIDPPAYTVVRLVSGMAMLWLLVFVTTGRGNTAGNGSWRGASMLFLYAIAFSFAYVHLDTATGALILFGAVQLTIIGVSFAAGHRPRTLEWLGVVTAVAGFVYLMAPGAAIPSIPGAALMAAAGVAWGAYTLIGRGSRNPLLDTAANFMRATPMVLAAGAVAWLCRPATVTAEGVVLAVLSGAPASGLGYALWYRALRGLSATQAGITQLMVPVIAALGGLLIVAEPLTPRLVAAGLLILGGILLDMLGRYRSTGAG